MTYRIFPETPLMDAIIEKYDSGYLFAKYFDKDMNVKEDAPEELKREIELLRKDA